MGFKNIMKSQFLHPFITIIKSYLVLILKNAECFQSEKREPREHPSITYLQKEWRGGQNMAIFD